MVDFLVKDPRARANVEAQTASRETSLFLATRAGQ